MSMALCLPLLAVFLQCSSGQQDVLQTVFVSTPRSDSCCKQGNRSSKRHAVHSLEPGPSDSQIHERGHLPQKECKGAIQPRCPAQSLQKQKWTPRKRGVWQATFPVSLATSSLAHGTLCTLQCLWLSHSGRVHPGNANHHLCSRFTRYCYAGAASGTTEAAAARKLTLCPEAASRVGSTFAPESPPLAWDAQGCLWGRPN